MTRQFTITVGAARREGRAPSHDGEYITIYTNPKDRDVLIAEHNAGTFCLDDQYTDDQEDWDAIKAEAYERAEGGNGGDPLIYAGFEAISEMVLLGWESASSFDGNFAEALRRRRSNRGGNARRDRLRSRKRSDG